MSTGLADIDIEQLKKFEYKQFELLEEFLKPYAFRIAQYEILTSHKISQVENNIILGSITKQYCNFFMKYLDGVWSSAAEEMGT